MDAEGVAEGRQIFVNLKRSIEYALNLELVSILTYSKVYNLPQYTGSDPSTSLWVRC